MRSHAFFLGFTVLAALGCSGGGGGSSGSGGPTGSFDELSMIFEMNETDGDAEVVIEAQGEEAFRTFSVTAPNGKRIIDVRDNNPAGIGLAEVALESGEPDVASVKAQYPEGAYVFDATTITGLRLRQEIVLTHFALPAPAYTPADGATVDPGAPLVIQWTAVPGVEGYIVEIEQDDLGVSLNVSLPASVTSFTVAPGLFEPGTEYELGVASVTPDGNVSVAESSFETQ
jgi:hypothetical protein